MAERNTKFRKGKIALFSCGIAMVLALPLGMNASASLNHGGFQTKATDQKDPEIFAIAGSNANAEAPEEDPRGIFSFTVDSTNPGCSGSLSTNAINFGLVEEGTTIKDPDGVETPVTGKVIAAKDGKWVLRGSFGRIINATQAGPSSGIARCVTSIDQWSNTETTTLHGAFRGAWSLQRIAEPPHTVSIMSNLFVGANQLNDPTMSNWDMSNVTDTSGMFSSTPGFTQDLSKWDVSNVQTMKSMFSGATPFKGTVGHWDVRNVTNMDSMFRSENGNFEEDLSSWKACKIPSRPVDFTMAANPALEPQWGGTCS